MLIHRKKSSQDIKVDPIWKSTSHWPFDAKIINNPISSRACYIVSPQRLSSFPAHPINRPDFLCLLQRGAVLFKSSRKAPLNIKKLRRRRYDARDFRITVIHL